MVMATSAAEPKPSIQFGPSSVQWSFVPLWIEPVAAPENGSNRDPVRAMYARLASAHLARPTVPDYGGGLPEDRYAL